MTGTMAPGKQCVTALKKQICRVMASPTINVVGEKRGRGGGGGCGSREDRSGCCCGETVVEMREEHGRLPECLITASLRSLQ